MIKNGYYIIIFIISIAFVYYFNELFETVDESIKSRSLENDGFCVLQNDKYIDTENFPCNELRDNVMSKLPKGYIFMDYVYTPFLISNAHFIQPNIYFLTSSKGGIFRYS